MSTNLYWRPKSTKKNNAGKDVSLKWALQKEYGDRINVILGVNNISYLRGLMHGNVDGAKDLIDAIEKYNEIEVFEE